MTQAEKDAVSQTEPFPCSNGLFTLSAYDPRYGVRFHVEIPKQVFDRLTGGRERVTALCCNVYDTRQEAIQDLQQALASL